MNNRTGLEMICCERTEKKRDEMSCGKRASLLASAVGNRRRDSIEMRCKQSDLRQKSFVLLDFGSETGSILNA